jgi:hypothetical protein
MMTLVQFLSHRSISTSTPCEMLDSMGPNKFDSPTSQRLSACLVLRAARRAPGGSQYILVVHCHMWKRDSSDLTTMPPISTPFAPPTNYLQILVCCVFGQFKLTISLSSHFLEKDSAYLRSLLHCHTLAGLVA